MDDLETTMPYSREELDSYIKLLDIDLEAFRKKALEEISDPWEREGYLKFKLVAKDLEVWHQLKKAFQGITEQDEEIFRIVCRYYLRRFKSGKTTPPVIEHLPPDKPKQKVPHGKVVA
jgi:hypothetical protein